MQKLIKATERAALITCIAALKEQHASAVCLCYRHGQVFEPFVEDQCTESLYYLELNTRGQPDRIRPLVAAQWPFTATQKI